ncbi:MAG: sigma-70 family RNA polymerase sigma factor [Actinomycetota bacterium]|nr:sigma-70 family RNA polymerase sigma factor [Actinomycetota bacterium]
MRKTTEGATLDEIEHVYRERLPEYRRVAAAIVGDRELALDAVQEGFAIAVRQRATFRGDGSLEAWLWRIVVNAARGQQRRRPDAGELPDQPDALDNGSAADPHELVRAALSLLPERQRLVLFLRYYADLDYGAIADTLDISTGTVGATLSSAHASMSRLLEEVAK